MWIKFNFKTKQTGLAGSEIPATVKFAIEVEEAENALNVANDFSNNNKVTDVKVMLNRPTDADTIYINKDGYTQSNSQHLVTNSDTQSFIWAIKAGISMGKALN